MFRQMKECEEVRRSLDGWIDGEAAEPPHLSECPECRREAEARRKLRDRLRAVRLPAPKGLEERLRAALRRRTGAVRWLPPAVAAALLVGTLFFLRPRPSEPVPDLVSRAADFHDRISEGSVRPEELSDPEALRRYFRDTLLLDVEVPPPRSDASLSGGCCCTAPDGRYRMPCIVYRVRGIPMSLLVFEGPLPPMPSAARRERGGQEYFVFRQGRNAVLLCRAGVVCHLWVSAMEESVLLEAILGTSVGRLAFSGERLTLAGVT